MAIDLGNGFVVSGPAFGEKTKTDADRRQEVLKKYGGVQGVANSGISFDKLLEELSGLRWDIPLFDTITAGQAIGAYQNGTLPTPQQGKEAVQSGAYNGTYQDYMNENIAKATGIQANMNKAHRDRLAFMRICSGKFSRDTEYYHVQGKKKMRLSQPQQLMAAEREIVEEAYAGDVIGVFDPGIFAIGDTITVPGKKFSYSGIPTFAPEHFCRVSAKDSMKRKQFVKGTEQIAQEGAIQIFKLPNSGMEEVIVGVVGVLQLEVFQYRMKTEYGVDLRMENLPYEEIRLIDEYPGDLSDLNLGSDAELLEDYRGRSLLVFSSFWAIDFTCRRNPGLKVKEIVVEEG